MVDRVQRQAETGEVEATLAASRLAFALFQADHFYDLTETMR